MNERGDPTGALNGRVLRRLGAMADMDAHEPSGTLTDREIEDLLMALDDEYKARATYRQVLADFGEVRPFSNIVEAEQRHIDALLVLFERYGIEVPDDPWPGQAPRFSSIEDACQAGVQDEIDNAALYDRLLAGTEREDLLATYRNLQRASQENHLPAFERHAQPGEKGGGGRGGQGPGGEGPEGQGRGGQRRRLRSGEQGRP